MARVDPQELLTAQQRGLKDINDMQLTLTLDIESIATEASSTTQSSSKELVTTAPVQESLAQILVILGVLFAGLQFVLWLIAQELNKRGWAPRLAAILGWLPRRLLEYRSRGTSAGSSNDPRSD